VSAGTPPVPRLRIRKRGLAVLACLIALVVCGVNRWRGASSAGAPTGEFCQVLHITDGDTIKVRYEGKETPVRLLRINTPERGQPGAKQATEAMREMVQGREVLLEFEEPGRPERDAYDRLLAYVYADGRNVNVEEVRLGWSKFWTTHGEGKYAREFQAAEAEARAAKRGIWKLE
jgi:micrococcal nuclease